MSNSYYLRFILIATLRHDIRTKEMIELFRFERKRTKLSFDYN